MPIVRSPEAFNTDDLFVDLQPVVGSALFLKCEGFNFAGSIKLKAATGMVQAAERAGRLDQNSVLVESSSGNLGIALSMIAAAKGLRFLCVTDVRCNPAARRTMEAFGAEVHVVTEPQPDGGLLGARIALVRRLCATDDRYVWLDQYSNQANATAHYLTTAPAIVEQFPMLDVLFVGAGTTGTLMGCARFLREWHRRVRIVAVDSVGSVTFGGEDGPRFVPGLGTGIRPPLLDESLIDEVVRVDEVDGVRLCRRLARRGFLFGGSTGSVVSAAEAWLARPGRQDLTAVAIAPDLGDRYLDTVHDEVWAAEFCAEGPPRDTRPASDRERRPRVAPAGPRRARRPATTVGHTRTRDVPEGDRPF